MNTTTCFGPIYEPSSGCYLTYRAAIQDVWGVFLRVLGIGCGERGDRNLVFSSGYHGLRLLLVDYHELFMYTCQVGYYSYAKYML